MANSNCVFSICGQLTARSTFYRPSSAFFVGSSCVKTCRKLFGKQAHQGPEEPRGASIQTGASLKPTLRQNDLRDLDRDLIEVLDLATDEELEEVYRLLFGEQLVACDADVGKVCSCRSARE